MLANHHPTNQVQQVIVTDANAGQRVDNFLLSLLRGLPKSRLYRIIRKGEVRVNKRRVDVSYKLNCGDCVRVPPVRLAEKGTEVCAPSEKFAKFLADAICYEDDQLIIVNKPAGLAVHGGSGISLGLIEALRAMRPKAPFLELVHRIDRDTSGCIMIAKRRSILIHLHDALKAGTIKKRYLALVAGQWRGGKVIEAPLFKYVLRSGERMVRVDPTGKQSQTNIKTLESFPGATLIEASPVTGRTHQIRVHCQFMGHPIVGDQKYGELEFNRQAKIKGLDRLFLHAHQLVIKLPYDPFDLTITCPLPETCETYLAQLRA